MAWELWKQQESQKSLWDLELVPRVALESSSGIRPLEDYLDGELERNTRYLLLSVASDIPPSHRSHRTPGIIERPR